MNKRKRDIFTVIESVYNWFEAGDHSTDPTTDHEGVCGVPNHITNLETSITVNRQAAKNPTSVREPKQQVKVSVVG